ncbi:hypothetical protein HY933_01370 [Candidatus Falkowbacteria bacterium]|nr:hypothetical protein [Candidatus Falkowbacteria bacterium]
MPTCKQCTTDFTITDADKTFYARIDVPKPELCVRCRWQWLLSFWPFGNFYQRQCDKTGQTIISTFSPDAPFPVYKKEEWMKDDWPVPESVVALDQPFLPQLEALQQRTPHYHQLTDNQIINCDYSDDLYACKNCYLSRAIFNCEDLYFSYRIFNTKDSFDCVYSYNLENCYSCTRCWQCYNCQYCLESRDCLDSRFLYDCRGCKNCFLCWNLRNAQYCIGNQQYSADAYQEKLAQIHFNSWQTIQQYQQEFSQQLRQQAIHKATFNIKSIQCEGNYLTECKNCQTFFFGEGSEDCSYLFRATRNKDSLDGVGLFESELCCSTCQSVYCYNCQFTTYTVRCRDSEYIDQCEDCADCFGCVGLRHKKYCILNKQYSEEEYRRLKEQLIGTMKTRGEYGQFFPQSMMYNGYNDTLASFYFPQTKEQSVQRGARWQEDIIQEAHAEFTAAELPDELSAAGAEQYIGKTVQCSQTGKIFRYIPQEIAFYQKNSIPLPRYYYNYRITENFKRLAPPWSRQIKCSRCGAMTTTYFPEEWGYRKIYCQQCYEKEIY